VVDLVAARDGETSPDTSPADISGRQYQPATFNPIPRATMRPIISYELANARIAGFPRQASETRSSGPPSRPAAHDINAARTRWPAARPGIAPAAR
jgi:hypothetical protein